MFESGPNGLSRTLWRKGMNVILVGANGAAYHVDEWPRSRTFRQLNQENLLTKDNHMRAFASFDIKNK